MNSKQITFPIYEGSFMTVAPVVDQSINILRFRDEQDKPYNILINRVTLLEGKTPDDFCESQVDRMKRFVPGFEEEGKRLKHEIGPAKLPLIQMANKYLEEGEWVKQVISVVTLPYHPQINPDKRNLIIFTLAADEDFTDSQRKHYVKVINSFVPNEVESALSGK